MIKILLNTCDYAWAGGLDLIFTLARALKAQSAYSVDLYILIHDESFAAKNNFLSRVLKHIKTEKQNLRKSGNDFNYYDYVHEIFEGEKVNFVYCNKKLPYTINHIINSIKPDVFFPILYSEDYQNVTCQKVGYIFDFVYRKYPELYTPKFCLSTDINFALNLLNCRKVIVNAKTVANDIKKYFPYVDNEILVLPFTPNVPERYIKTSTEINENLNRYNLSNDFFIVSNQFWPHKSHDIVILAFKKLLEENKNSKLQLVFTGAVSDFDRTNAMLLKVNKLVRELDLVDNVRILGHIPRGDLVSLMRSSLAVIQPTTFEGGPGGGSVAMALSLGIPCIVSDIEVNKEIGQDKYIYYFEVNNVDDLVKKMNHIMTNINSHDKIGKQDIINNNNNKLAIMGEYLIKNIIC